MRPARKLPGFVVAPQRSVKVLPRENITWFWNPGRIGVKRAPEWFDKKLKELGDELEITWSPVHERWLVWMRKPSFNHPVCQGWLLLFIVQEPDGSYRPLDERIMARLYESSARKWGSGKAYFDNVTRVMEREEETRRRDSLQDTIDRSMDVFDHSQIRVGYGPSNGSKFSKYHA